MNASHVRGRELRTLARALLGLASVFLVAVSLLAVVKGKWALGSIAIALPPSWLVAMALEYWRRRSAAPRSQSRHTTDERAGAGPGLVTGRRAAHSWLLEILLGIPAIGLFLVAGYLMDRGYEVQSCYFSVILGQVLIVSRVLVFFHDLLRGA